MGLDINDFRKEKGGDPDKIRESQRRRYQPVEIVDQVIELDQDWRKAQFDYEGALKELNILQKSIGERKKANKTDTCEDLVQQKLAQEEKIKNLKQVSQEKQDQRDNLLKKVGNIVHDSVPVDNNEDNNTVVRTWGDIPDIKITETPGAAHHHQILYMLDGYDPKRGQKVAGQRGYFLKNYGVILVQALQSYGQQFLMARGYTPMYTPFFMRKKVMGDTCQLSDFDDQLYKIDGSSVTHAEEQKASNDDKEKYLIATSEQPISAYHADEWINAKELPYRYAGLSTCFRKEAGAAGRETWGIFRVHQFEKIEQFVITKPEDSWEELERMINVSEEFMKSLKLPYRVINIVSGALNDAASKKYDLEAWFPGYGQYKELVSCSNCTDFQSRGLNVVSGDVVEKKGGEKTNEKAFVHMLNGTLCAAQRTLTCILENYQEKDGVRVPEVLVPFVGKDFLPYKIGMPSKKEFQ